jgi:hypothetical protein
MKMFSKYAIFFSLMAIVIACSTESRNKSESTIDNIQKTNINDTSSSSTLKIEAIDLFIDSMKSENYLLEPNRIKEVVWSHLVHFPDTVNKGHKIIQMPFPVEVFQHHFTFPKTYFFAKWNEKENTYKGGNDYLLMTWTIDSAGIKDEKNIYASLHEFMGNFPCYIFRSGHTVYAMSHRLTAEASETRKLTERLRDYIDTNSSIYSPISVR